MLFGSSLPPVGAQQRGHVFGHGDVVPTTVLLIASGKGGVGTSVVAALTAHAAARRGMRTLLVDASESGGAQHHLFGVRPAHALWSLADPRCDSADVLMSATVNLGLVAGCANGAAVAPTTETERRAALRRLADVYDHFDLVVFDGGSRPDTIAAISEATDSSLVLVTSGDRLALAANYVLLKSVHSRGGRTGEPVLVIANRQNEAGAQEACEFLMGACSHYLARTVGMAGSIPDDPRLQAAVSAGMSLPDVVEGSPAADAIRSVLSQLVPAAGSTVWRISPPLLRRWS